MQSERKITGRVDEGRPAKSPKKAAASDSKPKKQPRSLARPPARGDIRLNVGLCGQMGPEGNMPGPLRCEMELVDTPDPTVPPEVVQPPRPQDVTWEEVLTESKNVAFPPRRVMVQPAERTLVNLDTIVYTTESGISTDVVTLLGFPVEVEATPISYTWNFGDGGPKLITTTPGKPHPAKEITHKYLKRASVNLTLTTNYAARFNVAGTGWQYVAGTVPITGPATALLVREAVPVLVDPPN
ncbi:MAG TPA: PKD domain-containing protein [Kribbella sp.]|uniref:PKD domain-containing protein n=1 Tax=Kribbella sp. TaxID=1871183 RepID=UPI002D78E69E|nr:PKD domain-containing protein [Kribbella sp.]HET6297057.1 PKD domain-containing protein [Kribbella sp.]